MSFAGIADKVLQSSSKANATMDFIADLDAATYNAFINHRDQLVVIMFTASWCAPCRKLGPVMESVAAEFPESVKAARVDVDAFRQLAVQAGVDSIPDVRIFHNGRQIHQFRGAKKFRELRLLFGQYVEQLEQGTLTPPDFTPELQPLARDLRGIARDFHVSPLPVFHGEGIGNASVSGNPADAPIRPMDPDWMPPGIQRR